MAINLSNHLRIIVSLCFFALACFCSASNKPRNGGGFKGMFIFGSSVVDNGNNNNLNGSTSKANFLPYGIDFNVGPTKATGRFSNGKNIADLIGDHLKLPLIPSFANTQTQGDSILYGVNFGSGGSGILNETGAILGKVISLHEQITNFEEVTLPKLESRLRRQRDKILPNYLFLVAAGNNDYAFHLLLPPESGSQSSQSAEAFAANLITFYSVQLKRLYKAGARNFLVLSAYPLGCIPIVSKGRGCLPELDAYISVFYDQLISKVKQMKHELPGIEFIILNSVKVITDIINNANSSTGLSNVNDPCCELSSNGSSCKVNGTTCDDRKRYAFFDINHYTEAACAIIAAKVYGSRDRTEVFPVNLYRLSHRQHSNLH